MKAARQRLLGTNMTSVTHPLGARPHACRSSMGREATETSMHTGAVRSRAASYPVCEILVNVDDRRRLQE